MSLVSDAAVRVLVDPTNPGEFFACCGLLELAERLWDGAEGWFSSHGPDFVLRPRRAQPNFESSLLIDRIAESRLTNTMTDAQLQRRAELSAMPKMGRESVPSLEVEKKALDTLWREAPVLLHEPFDLRLDWFVDDRSGGDMLKTWAGQQSVLDIASGMKEVVGTKKWIETPTQRWLSLRTKTDHLPFNFDSDLGGVGTDRDVGFSFDPLKTVKVQKRPLVELLAFVGLQRFRPRKIAMANRYRFALWFDPMVPEIAALAACDLLESPSSQAFEFPLLYRTKYLKSFLPATPIARS